DYVAIAGACAAGSITAPAMAEAMASPAADGVWTELSSPTGVRNLAFPLPLASEAQQYSTATAEILTAAAAAVDGPVPQSVAEALEGPEGTEWMAAMQDELSAHDRDKTWRRSSRVPHGRNVIGCRWVFATKRAADRAILRYKARLVPQGFSQRPGVDYGATFAPVMSADAMRFIFALATEFDFEVHQMDVVTANLNAPLTDLLWMRVPPGPFGFEDCAALQL
ncbi:unnamed protein product, partial [Phaeothamnion confervicola]